MIMMAGTCLFSSAVLTSHMMLWGIHSYLNRRSSALSPRSSRKALSAGWSSSTDGLLNDLEGSRRTPMRTVLGMERCAWVMVRGVEEGWRIVIALLRLPRAWWRIPRPKRSGGFGLIAVFLTEQQLGSVKSRVSISRQPRRGMPR
jgi:hypothetical protein